MQLSKLSIRGFKSFPDQSNFSFEPGITAIVGPNGCGKSNVTEAIRWVLGEQNVYALRGRRTEDLIFNGTENRRPLGMAEVSLSITHTPNSAGLPQRGSIKMQNLPFSEVAVTRRIFRSGESEYFINKTPCRLRDINELFMDTGVGVNAYSMIGQDQVERILNSKPEERRSILEEAAGIVKYNARKNEAIRKLELVKENLVRVGDIIAELQRQIDFLKRQAAKAKRYQKYNARLKELEVGRNYHLYCQGKMKAEEIEERIREGETSEENLLGELQGGKEKLEKLREELKEVEEVLEKHREEELHLSTGIEKCNSNILLWEERKEYSQAKKDQLEKGREELQQVYSSSLEREKELEEALQEAESSRRELEKQLKQNQETILGFEEERKKHNQEIEKQNSSLFQLVVERSKLKNSLESVSIKLHNAGVNVRRLEKEQEELERERKDLEERLRNQLAEQEKKEKKVETLTKEVEKGKENLEKCRREANSLEQKMNSLDKEYQEKKLHLETIKEMEERREGYSRATTYLLEEKKDNIYGLLTDILRVPANLRKAVEVALRANLQGVMVQNEETALQLIETLKEKGLGRATFLWLDRLKPRKSKDKNLPNLLLNKVKFPAQYQRVVAYLLGKVVIAKDIEEARRFSSTLPPTEGWMVATLSGELLLPEGILYGGSWKEREVLTGRKDWVSSLQKKISDLEREIGKVARVQKENLHSLQEREKQVEEKQRELEERVAEVEQLAQRKAKDLERQREILGRKKIIAQERERTREEGRRTEEERAQIETQLSQVEEKIAQHQSAVESLKSSLLSLRDKRGELSQQAEEWRIKATSLKESARRYAEDISEINRGGEKNEKEKARIEDQLSEVKDRMEKLGEEVRAEKEKLQEMQNQRNTLQESLGEYRGKRGKLDSTIREKEKAMLLEGQELDRKKNELQTLRIERATLTTQLNNLKETAYHSHEVDLEKLTPEEVGVGTDVEDEIEEIRNKVKNMGNVNLAAIDEEEELSERYNFYADQQKDLLESENSLQRSIREINHTTRELLRTAFEQVRKAFRQVCQDLFQGGEGNLKLVDSNDILEAGVDITVCPPGKKTQSINLLSGGEKALTAIALLFALFRVKPSPFCVLDEVDAALDEPNIERFTTYLRNLAKENQFVIISHNRRTLAMADILYGVTMEEPGVSKLISVKFKGSPHSPTHRPAYRQTGH